MWGETLVREGLVWGEGDSGKGGVSVGGETLVREGLVWGERLW